MGLLGYKIFGENKNFVTIEPQWNGLC